jgi:polyribonucleotide nucleotidyltransferase
MHVQMRARTGDAKRAEGAGSRILEAALSSAMPNPQQFPFAVRLTADILALDGSAASAAVSSGSLALISAGVPITSPVAGACLLLSSSVFGPKSQALASHRQDLSVLFDRDLVLGNNAHLRMFPPLALPARYRFSCEDFFSSPPVR